MACRIGPFAAHYYHEIHKLGGKLYLNPDGHEWMRAKWSAPVRKYWKLSEQSMVRHCDLVICDSINIEKYIRKKYGGRTTFIAYGAEVEPSRITDDDRKLNEWYKSKKLRPKEYYLAVGRFVPENNFETMIREFMASNTKKDFAIITTDNDAFMDKLEKKLHFKNDQRIKFVGTVYDQELLKKIRENAYGYFHGHEVGGTNPSLLEALASTNLNLLLDVGFNREVAEEAALYWTKNNGSLAKLIDQADQLGEDEIAELRKLAKKRICEEYSWERICNRYGRVFLSRRGNDSGFENYP
jgi:rhamnosyltransferase